MRPGQQHAGVDALQRPGLQQHDAAGARQRYDGATAVCSACMWSLWSRQAHIAGKKWSIFVHGGEFPRKQYGLQPNTMALITSECSY